MKVPSRLNFMLNASSRIVPGAAGDTTEALSDRQGDGASGGRTARSGHENSFMTTERFCAESGSTAWAESTGAGVAAGVSSLELSHGGSAWLRM